MKKLILSLLMVASITSFATGPQITKAVKTTYHIEPDPPKESPNGYLVDCCHTINLGWNFSNTCVSYLIDCWGACSGHGWLIDVCSDGTTVIRGAFVHNGGSNGPIKTYIPLTTGIIDSKFDKSLDPISQVVEFKKIENTIFELPNELTIETDAEFFIFKAGKYQIINSNLMIIASKTDI